MVVVMVWAASTKSGLRSLYNGGSKIDILELLVLTEIDLSH